MSSSVEGDPQRVFEPSDEVTSANGAVHALFNLDHPDTGPFPSDIFTVADPTHNTGRRVNLPYPDCSVRVSDCEDLDVINTLDGFGLQTRISIPFDGPIDVNTATSDTVFLISLGSTLRHRGDDAPGTVVGINQIVWDTFTNTLHVESDELLAQHTRYALIVTNGLRDAGRAAGRSERGVSPVPADRARGIQAGAARGDSRREALRRARTRHRGRQRLHDTEHHVGDGENSRSDQGRHARAREFPARSEWRAGGLQSGGRDKHCVEPAHESEPSWLHPPHPSTLRSFATSRMQWERSRTASTALPNIGFQESTSQR